MAFTSVPGTITSLANSLKRVYDPEFFEAYQNMNAPAYKMAQAAPNIEADGEGYFWPAYLSTPQNMGSPAEGGDLPPVKQRLEVQLKVKPIQIVNSFKISWIMAAIGTERGTFGKAEVKRQMKECTTDLTKHMNRIIAGTHGSGRLGQIAAATTTSGTFVMKKTIGANNGAWLLRPKMLLDVYTLDSGGAISTAADDATQLLVATVNYTTHQVTVETVAGTPASLSLAANEHVYVYPDYNNTMNGFAGLFDDGTYLITVHNQSRNTYPQLSGTIMTGSGTLRPLTEEMLIDLTSSITQTSGEEVDTMVTNRGQLRQYLRFVIPNRRYPVTGRGVPDYQTGSKGNPEFLAGGKVIEIQPMEDVSPRTIYAFSKRLFRRFESQKLDWYRHGGPEGGILAQGIGTNGRNTSHEASIYTVTNVGYQRLNACGVLTDLLDPQMLGDPSE